MFVELLQILADDAEENAGSDDVEIRADSNAHVYLFAIVDLSN